jgi:hypothetical protein
MATVTNPDPRHSETSTVDHNQVLTEETSLEQVAAVQMAEELVRVSAPIRRPGLLVRLAGSLVAFNDWLSEPAMSKRDRLYRDIAKADPTRYTLGYDHWRR